MQILTLTYWIATTAYGVYWLIKHPASKFSTMDGNTPDEYVTLLEILAKTFPAALLAWMFVPMLLLSKIKFKRN